MFERLKSLSRIMGSQLGGDQQADPSGLAPERPLLVVGDIHGRADLLNQIVADANAFVEGIGAGERTPQPQLIFVGDYVDRGERSAEVLDWLFTLNTEAPDQVTCLMGNHELMMLEFLDDPVGRGRRWLRNGGLQTLASFQIGNIRENADVETLVDVCEQLEAALPAGMLDWLRGLPLYYRSGNICVTHAAMDPHLSPEDQGQSVLLWGHPEFFSTPREDGLWVVHGHTIVPQPGVYPCRIAIDTGAYQTGRLTLAAITPGRCDFIAPGAGKTTAEVIERQ